MKTNSLISDVVDSSVNRRSMLRKIGIATAAAGAALGTGGIKLYNIDITGSGMPGATTGGNQVNFSNNFVFTGAVAAEIGQDERDHVVLLRTTLQGAGVTPIAKPAINLAALGTGFANEAQFLTLARVFEDIGVSAYGGAGAAPRFCHESSYWNRGQNISHRSLTRGEHTSGGCPFGDSNRKIGRRR